MPAVVAWLGRAFAWLFSSAVADNVARYVAGRALLVGLFTIILPIVLNNFIYDILDMGLSMINSQTSGASFNGGVSFSGLAAHWINLLRVPDCMSVVVSALVVRAGLNMIPLVRV